MTIVNAQTTPPDSPPVPWGDFVRFVRQLSHDLRNYLNAAELQSAYLGELTTDDELKDEIRRLREMMSELGAVLQKLSVNVAPPRPNVISYGAAEFVEDIRRKVANLFAKEQSAVEWDVQLPETNLQIDPQLLQEALVELFSNAFRHQLPGRSLKVSATIDRDSCLLTLREEKERFDSSPAQWGREPLRSVTAGHYGLGLNRVRAIVEAHGGQFDVQYEPTSAILATRIRLPLSGKRN
jgi:signal transduction histidine kinase